MEIRQRKFYQITHEDAGVIGDYEAWSVEDAKQVCAEDVGYQCWEDMLETGASKNCEYKITEKPTTSRPEGL